MRAIILHFILITTIFFSSFSNAKEAEVCSTLKKEKKYIPYSKENKPSMYLTDKNGNIKTGPIELGVLKFITDGSAIQTPSEYFLVLYPKQIKAENVDGLYWYSAKLEKTKDFCEKSNTYKISYQENGPYTPEAIDHYNKSLPKKINKEFHSNFTDSALDEGDTTVDPICRFDCRFVGTIVDGSKK
jgi:hypothetical protein